MSKSGSNICAAGETSTSNGTATTTRSSRSSARSVPGGDHRHVLPATSAARMRRNCATPRRARTAGHRSHARAQRCQPPPAHLDRSGTDALSRRGEPRLHLQPLHAAPATTPRAGRGLASAAQHGLIDRVEGALMAAEDLLRSLSMLSSSTRQNSTEPAAIALAVSGRSWLWRTGQ